MFCNCRGKPDRGTSPRLCALQLSVQTPRVSLRLNMIALLWENGIPW